LSLQKSLAKFLARPLVVRALEAYAATRVPCSSIHDLDGTLYMGRRWVIVPGTWQSKLFKRLTGYESVRLHRIMRPDHDRDMHNHPFQYRTFVLRGRYSEEYQFHFVPVALLRARTRTLFAGDTASTFGTPGFHRLTYVSRGGVLTLFCMTENVGAWGFDRDGDYVDSEEYLADKGYRNGGKA
jgi:hypothetical protein